MKHIESTPMRTFRQWHTWSNGSDTPVEADVRPPEASNKQHITPSATPSATPGATPTATPAATPHATPRATPAANSPVPEEAAKSPEAQSPPANGTFPTCDRVLSGNKPQSDALQSPFPGAALRTPPVQPAIKYINREPLSSGQIPDSEPPSAPPNGKLASTHTAAGKPDADDSKRMHRTCLPNGVVEGSDAARPGPSSRRPSVLGKRSRERSTGAAATQHKKKEKAQDVTHSKKLQESRTQWGASATVMWRSPWYCSEILLPGGESLRLLHVAVLCQWRVKVAIEPATEKCQDSGAAGSKRDVTDNGEEQKRHYHVQWMHCTDDCAAAYALALHQLALLHRCHWEISLQQSLGDIIFREPRCAHWPIHCALAARGCLLSEMLQC